MRVLVTVVAFLTLNSAVLTAEGSKNQDNSYMILAPKIFRPGSTFTLKVTISNAKTPVLVTAGIYVGHYTAKRKLVVEGNGTFATGMTGDLNLEIPPGLTQTSSFGLIVNGTGGLNFYNMSYIGFRSKGMSIYVQMDKGIYKPGQTAHMRIFALLPNLRSYLGKMTVDILDPNNNKMAHWADVQGSSGIIKKDFPLSSQPVMGNWKVAVNAKGEKFEKTFEVKEYVLPKFEVTLTLPPYVLKKDANIQGSVSSKYTYGKYVKGSVVIEAFFNYYSYNKERVKLKKELKLEGTASTSFHFKAQEIVDLFLRSYSWAKEKYLYQSWYSLTINATVTEELTKTKFSEQKSVKFHYTDVKLEFPPFNPKNYKPKLEFITMLRVTKPDGQPMDPSRLKAIKILVKSQYNWGGNKTKDDYTPSPEGIIVIQKKVPSNAFVVHFEAEYYVDGEYTEKAYFTASKSESPSNSYLQLSTDTPSVKSGDKVEFKVLSNFPVLSYVYLVVARGKIRQIDSGEISGNPQEFTFSLTSTTVMAPSAYVVVYSITKNGEVVVDSLTITVENPFDNKVSLKFSRKSARPGDQVRLVAKATPGSHVAFLAVDKSVLLMKKDNDINQNQVLQELQSYGMGNAWYPWWEWGWFRSVDRRRRRMIMPFPTSGSDAMSVFENSGLIVFSDFLVFRKQNFYPIMYASVPESSGGSAGAGGDEFLRKASNGAGSNTPLAAVTKVRSLFPETWLWIDRNASESGSAEISTSVPDTITSWVASAFAISPTTGFGLGAIKPKIQVFQPFFVTLDLPYSVVRGEEVAIKALVFNYLEEPQEVTITFKGSPNWGAINESGPRGTYEQEAVDMKEILTVPAGEGKAIAFPIIPKALGNIPLVVQAQSYVAADAVRRNLLVVPEGVPQEYSYSVLIDLNTTSSFTKTLELSLPKSVVKGSAYAKVSVIGDILGSSFSNLENLLRMPYGCGEQNMVNFAPNIFVLKYLTAVNKVTSAITAKCERYMVQGYQREQTYRHRDGSYSAFGERDKQGSMWLTAFVVKSFAQAREYIYVDPASLKLSLEFMARKQNKDGSFPKVGHVHGSYLKGGLKGEASLTAFVVIALAEADSSSKVVSVAKQEAVKYLENKLDTMIKNKDVYALSISAYALRLVNSASSGKARLALLAMAIRKDGTIHWSNANQDGDKSTTYHPYYRPRSADIEITAYALLTLSLNKDIGLGLPVVRWLSQQRNSLGGYSSTQDTVLGIQAMSEFAALIYSSSQKFKLVLTQTADKSFRKIFMVDTNNAMVLQQTMISKVEGSLKIAADGNGVGLLQVGVTYHVDKAPGKSNFDFIVEILSEGNYEIETESCAKWQGEGDNSDMAVMELGVASGFSPDQDHINKLLGSKDLFVKRVDTQDKKLIIYFDKINKQKATCILMRFQRTHPVGKGQPVPAVVYDYYNPEHRAEILYAASKLRNASVCRVCPICINCKHVIEPPIVKKKRSSGPGFSNSPLVTLTFVALSLMAVRK